MISEYKISLSHGVLKVGVHQVKKVVRKSSFPIQAQLGELSLARWLYLPYTGR